MIKHGYHVRKPPNRKIHGEARHIFCGCPSSRVNSQFSTHLSKAAGCQGGVQLKPAKARELLLGSGGNPEKLEVFSGGFMAGKKPVTLGNSLKFDPSRGFLNICRF